MTDERPHVVYLLSAYPVLSQTFVRNEVHALRARGVRVTVMSLKAGDSASIDAGWAGDHTVVPEALGWTAATRQLTWWALHHPYRLLRMLTLLLVLGGRGGAIALRQLPGALRPLQGQDVIAVHTHFGWRAAAPCLYAGKLLNAPASVTLHANDIYVPSPGLGRRLQKFDRLVTVCSYNVGVIRRLAAPMPPISLVPCGVDVPDEPPAPVTGARLLSVGRLVPKKGFADLVTAMETVLAARPDATLEIIGDGPDADELRRQVDDSPARASITLSGSRPNDYVLRQMSTCSAFVLACRVEPDGGSDALPVVIRESMARGRPVVSTNVAGIPETLDGVGWVVPSGDVTALASAILSAISPGPEPQRRGRDARRRVEESYTLAHTAIGMCRVFGLS